MVRISQMFRGAQLPARASDFDSEGWGFESLRDDQQFQRLRWIESSWRFPSTLVGKQALGGAPPKNYLAIRVAVCES